MIELIESESLENKENIKDKILKKMNRRNPKGFVTESKIGTKNVFGRTEAEFIQNRIHRKRLLTLPPEIEKANPDKHFVYLDMNALQRYGMYDPNGYTLYKVSDDPENMNNTKFNRSIDGYVHRNELVLAYIPKEEFEMRQLEDQIARGRVDLEEMFGGNTNLKGFDAYADKDEEVVPLSERVEERLKAMKARR